jgi:hypothetical protein
LLGLPKGAGGVFFDNETAGFACGTRERCGARLDHRRTFDLDRLRRRATVFEQRELDPPLDIFFCFPFGHPTQRAVPLAHPRQDITTENVTTSRPELQRLMHGTAIPADRSAAPFRDGPETPLGVAFVYEARTFTRSIANPFSK